MDWTAFFGGLTKFFNAVISHGWGLALALALFAVIWRQGWPWFRRPPAK